ncbi:MAG: VCBS repeat-containing protein [bacterium]
MRTNGCSALVLSFLWATGIASAQTLTEYVIVPSTTDAGITNFDQPHLVFHSPDEPLNTLVLFLPGSDSAPHSYTNFIRTAAELGFHTVGLMYPNSPLINQDCTNTPADCDCHGKARLEVLTGANVSPVVDVDRANSIENRLIKVLEHLQGLHPSENWTQFLDGQSIRWSNIIVAGHSQGAGHAGFIAKQFPVLRCAMFSDNDWCYSANQPANWLFQAGVTPVDRVFGFVHELDTLALSNQVVANWQAYGLTALGPILVAEDVGGPPYDGTHTLMTRLAPNSTGPIAYHDAPATDRATPVADNQYVLKPLWEFFLIDWISGHSFDGDDAADISVYHDNSGEWHFLHSGSPYSMIVFGYNGTEPIERDFDGDGRLDLGVFDPAKGFWHLLRSKEGYTNYSFGYRGVEPVPADFDGDRKADIAVFDDNTGQWYLLKSREGYATAQFGFSGVVPVPADYDGDRKADLAVYDENSGTWYIQQSTLGFTTIQFGYKGTLPVPGDYDNDGKEDIGVYDESSGQWYIQKTLAGFTTFQFGFRGTIPVNRDFDGDGRADPGVFDPGSDTWYLQRSTEGFLHQQFGFGAVVPLGTPPN